MYTPRFLHCIMCSSRSICKVVEIVPLQQGARECRLEEVTAEIFFFFFEDKQKFLFLVYCEKGGEERKESSIFKHKGA